MHLNELERRYLVEVEFKLFFEVVFAEMARVPTIPRSTLD